MKFGRTLTQNVSFVAPQDVSFISPSSNAVQTSTITARPFLDQGVGKKATSAVEKQAAMVGYDASEVDLNAGLEQFSRADKEKIEYALVSGDTSGLTASQKAWINYQVSMTEDRILAEMTDEQAALLGLSDDTSAENEALYLEQQKAIAKQKKKQMAIYGVVGLAGLGLIAFLVKR